MKRKILNYGLFALLLGTVIFIGYRFFTRFNDTNARALDAIPEDAAFIIEIRDFSKVWDKLTHTNLMWPDIKNKAPFSLVNQVGISIEKASKKNKDLSNYLKENKIVVSFHPAGGGMNYLIAAGGIESEDQAISFLEDTGDKKVSQGRTFEDVLIVKIETGKQIHYGCYLNGVILVANQESLLEVAIKRLKEGKKFDDNGVFKKLNHTVSKTVDANIYIHHHFFPEALKLLVDKKWTGHLKQMTGFAQMSELDLLINPNNLTLSGFSIAPDSTAFLLQNFNNQEPQSFSITRYVPERINHMLFVGFSDVEKFYEDRLALLKKQNLLKTHQEELNTFNRENDCNLKQHILSWMGNESVLFTADYDSTRADNKFLIVRKNLVGKAGIELDKLAFQLDTAAKTIAISEGVDAKRLNGEGIFSLLLGELFTGLDKPYYIEGDEFIIFSTSPTALQKYLSDLAYDKVLARNANFVNYVNENLSDKANLFYYAQVGKSKTILHCLLDEKYEEQLESNAELFSHFDAFSWQISHSENMYYNRMHIQYNPSTKAEENTFWELTLKNTVSSKPQIIKNHITQTKDIFVQDDNYMIYLINNKGKLNWKKELVEKIIGDINQIDMFNNGKLQMVFCTESQLHILDINGKYVNGFPATLPKQATGQFAVFDYESDKNYRFMIPSGKTLITIDKEGKVVTGWNFEGAKSNINQAPEFHRINNKDYIFTVDDLGNIYILDRKGKPRFEVKGKLKNRSHNAVYFETGKEIENCKVNYSDTTGKIFRLYFSGRKDSLDLGKYTSDHHFSMIDANSDGKLDIVLHQENHISITGWNKEKIVEHHLESSIDEAPVVYVMKDRSLWLGALNRDEKLIYLIDQNGFMHERFPSPGTTLFMLDDFNNDGNWDFVVGAPLGKVFSYSIK